MAVYNGKTVILLMELGFSNFGVRLLQAFHLLFQANPIARLVIFSSPLLPFAKSFSYYDFSRVQYIFIAPIINLSSLDKKI